MFTGLIEATAQIARVEIRDGGRVLHLATPLADEFRPGESVALNGVCLTVVTTGAGGCTFEVSPETLRATTLGDMAAGRVVNLERPLRADARLGGHFVLGHVDARGRLAAIRAEGDYHWIDIVFPVSLSPWLIAKGSIAVDGVSLTIATLDGDRFGVQIVPFTWRHTNLGLAHVGDVVNLEADVIGKYVARQHDVAFGRDTGAPGDGRR